jgi:hypothetical protein
VGVNRTDGGDRQPRAGNSKHGSTAGTLPGLPASEQGAATRGGGLRPIGGPGWTEVEAVQTRGLGSALCSAR